MFLWSNTAHKNECKKEENQFRMYQNISKTENANREMVVETLALKRVGVAYSLRNIIKDLLLS